MYHSGSLIGYNNTTSGGSSIVMSNENTTSAGSSIVVSNENTTSGEVVLR